MEPDLPQQDHPATCVIAEHYSSATCVSLRFYSRKKKCGAFQKCYFNLLTSLKLR
jgi:hypothetical protein